jgi:hypothetical protein
MSKEETAAIVRSHINGLMEHFEAVQVFVTWPDEDRATHCYYDGAGNWYARIGMVKEMIEIDRAKTLSHELHD